MLYAIRRLVQAGRLLQPRRFPEHNLSLPGGELSRRNLGMGLLGLPALLGEMEVVIAEAIAVAGVSDSRDALPLGIERPRQTILCHRRTTFRRQVARIRLAAIALATAMER